MWLAVLSSLVKLNLFVYSTNPTKTLAVTPELEGAHKGKYCMPTLRHSWLLPVAHVAHVVQWLAIVNLLSAFKFDFLST